MRNSLILYVNQSTRDSLLGFVETLYRSKLMRDWVHFAATGNQSDDNIFV